MSLGPYKLPKDWRWEELQNVATRDVQSIRPADASKRMFNYLGLEHLFAGQFHEPEENPVQGRTIKSTCVRCKPGHVLYAKLRPYLNKVVQCMRPGVASTEFVPLQVKPGLAIPSYLAWFLRSPSFVGYANSHTTGSRMPRVSLKAFWVAPIPLPPLEEQRRIVGKVEALLERLREAQRLRQQAQQEADSFLQAVLHEVFAQLTANLVDLSDICEIKGGASLPNPETHIQKSQKVLLLKVAELNKPENTPRIITSDTHISANSAKKRRLRIIPPNSIIIPKRGGAIATNKKRVLTKPAILDPNLMAITPTVGELLPDYLFYWFLHLDLVTITSGSTVPQLNRQDLAPLKVALPPIAEQKAIIQYCNQASMLANEICLKNATTSNELNSLEQSILDRAFRGEL